MKLTNRSSSLAAAVFSRNPNVLLVRIAMHTIWTRSSFKDAFFSWADPKGATAVGNWRCFLKLKNSNVVNLQHTKKNYYLNDFLGF